MKIEVFLFIAALLLFTAFVQDMALGAFNTFPPGRRELLRKVCNLQVEFRKKVIDDEMLSI